MSAGVPKITLGRLSLRQTYWLTLLLLGVLSVASNVLLSIQVQTTASTAALVNTAGRQRMLAVRIAADAEHAAFTRDPERLNDLRAALATFEASHAQLADSASGLYTSGFSTEVQQFYAAQLNPRVKVFTAAAHRVLTTPLAQLRPQQPDVTLLSTQARGPLLKLLDQAVKLDEHRSDVVIARVQWLSWLRVGMVLALLLGLGLYVLQPMKRRNLELQTEALTDMLTGLSNRRAFERDLLLAHSLASRQNHTLGIMMLDLDELKAVNDQQGHQRGDALLRGYGQALAELFRHSDQVYRLGGDEFAVLLPGAAEDSAELLTRVEQAAQRLRQQGFPDLGASAGVALYPRDGLDTAALVKLADERMYACKRQRKAARSALVLQPEA